MPTLTRPKCRECDGAVGAHDLFCPWCGDILDGLEEATEDPSEVPSSEPAAPAPAPPNRKLKWIVGAGAALAALLVLIAVLVVPSGGADKTNREIIRTWADPGMKYHSEISASFNRLAAAAGDEDLQAVKEESAKMADQLRSFRLGLESSGPPPEVIAVEGRALIEASREYEQDSRALSACTTLTDCVSRITTATASTASFTTATQAMTAAIEGESSEA